MLRLLARMLGGFLSCAPAPASPVTGLADASGGGSSAAACAEQTATESLISGRVLLHY